MSIKYGNLYEIENFARRRKYLSLLIESLKNDKWTQTISPSDGSAIYQSPSYGDHSFFIHVSTFNNVAYVKHRMPVIKDRYSEMISDEFPKDLDSCVRDLMEKVFTPEIYEIEKSIGNNRKGKLEFFEIEQLKEIIEDTYQDWLKNESEVTAKLIAKIIFSYRRKEEIYNLWLEKFGDTELIINNLKKLKGE